MFETYKTTKRDKMRYNISKNKWSNQNKSENSKCCIRFQKRAWKRHFCRNDIAALYHLQENGRIGLWENINYVLIRYVGHHICRAGKIPRLRCHPEVTPDQTVPDESYLWSDPPRPKYPLIRLKCARNTVCALNALETVSDQTFPDGKDLWSDHNQTIAQTIVQPWPSPSPDHCPDDCALKITSDQTIVRSKVTPDQTIVR